LTAALAAAAWVIFLPGCSTESEEGGCPDEPGIICTWAGTGAPGFNNDGLPLTESMLYWPIDVSFAADGTPFLVDWNNHRVREVTPDGTLRTIIGTDFIGDGPPDLSDLTAPGSPGTECSLNHPTQVLELPNGKLLLVAWHNHKLREYDRETGLVLVTAGAGAGFYGDGGPMSAARFNQPGQAALGADGSLYLLDQRNQVVRKVAGDGTVSTVVGTPKTPGFAGDGGAPLEAQMSLPTGSNPPPGGSLVLDAQGRLYFSDTLNHRVRRVDFDKNLVETVAGTGQPGDSGDGGPGTSATLNNPRGLAIGPDGRVYVADELNHRIRALDPETGVIHAAFGTGVPGYTGDGGPATAAALNRPAALTFHDDHVYITDTYNHVIRRMRL